MRRRQEEVPSTLVSPLLTRVLLGGSSQAVTASQEKAHQTAPKIGIQVDSRHELERHVDHQHHQQALAQAAGDESGQDPPSAEHERQRGPHQAPDGAGSAHGV